MKIHPWVLLGACILLCLGAWILGSFVTVTGPGSWYGSLEKPSFTPPNAVFGPVWTMLYILMGISLYLVITSGAPRERIIPAVAIFLVQLILNTLWSFLFFGLESPSLGLIGIIALWVAIVATIAFFYPLRRSAAILLVPYIAWVSVATVLTYTIGILNP